MGGPPANAELLSKSIETRPEPNRLKPNPAGHPGGLRDVATGKKTLERVERVAYHHCQQSLHEPLKLSDDVAAAHRVCPGVHSRIPSGAQRLGHKSRDNLSYVSGAESQQLAFRHDRFFWERFTLFALTPDHGCQNEDATLAFVDKAAERVPGAEPGDFGLRPVSTEPENRLVAAELEKRWNDALTHVTEMERRLEEAGALTPQLTAEQRLQTGSFGSGRISGKFVGNFSLTD
jgi:hypothetical protein